MKTRIAYAVFFSLCLFFFLVLITSSKSPEESIVGVWKEVSWEYEKVDKSSSGESITKQIDDNLKNEIIENLIIHKAEMWHFTNNGRLILYNGDKPAQELQWKLKGRGHVLKLNHHDNKTEFYDLYELTNNKLVLYLDIDMQVRGIVKMTFQRVKG